LQLPYYIAKKTSNSEKGTFTSSIQRVAIISIASAIFSLMIAFMILGGFQKVIKEKIFSFSGHLIISAYSLTTSFEDSSIKINPELTQQLNENQVIKKWQPFALKAGLLKTPEDVQGIIFKGIDARFDSTYFKQNIIAGRFPNILTEDYSTEVAISKKIANYLRLNVGDKVLIYFVQNPPRYRNLTVTGIYETGLEDFDEKIILGDIHLVQRINLWDENQASGIEVFVQDPNDVMEAQDEIFAELPSNLYVENVEDKFLQLFDWLALLNRNVAIFLTLILLVACFSMVSILLILIMERTQMIGVLKAMGANDQLIRNIFLHSGIRLVIFGMGWGNVLALGFGLIQYYFGLIPLDPVNYYMSEVPIMFSWPVIISLNGVVLVLITLSLFIPIRIISGISPIKSIRFD